MKVLIVGGGKVGTYLAGKLLEQKHEVKLLELRAEEKARILNDLPEKVLVIGNGTDPDFLEAQGIRKMDVVAAVTGSDETNLVISCLARSEFWVPRIIGRVNHPKNAWMFTPEMGVDVAINQADLLAQLIQEEMSLGDMMTLSLLRKGNFSLVEEKISPSARAVGKRLADLPLPEQCNIVAVIRAGKMITPHGDLVFQADDEVLAVVQRNIARELARLFDRPNA